MYNEDSRVRIILEYFYTQSFVIGMCKSLKIVGMHPCIFPCLSISNEVYVCGLLIFYYG